MKDNVIQLKGGSAGAETLRKLADLLEQDKITSLIVAANEPYNEEKRKEFDSRGVIHRYWFSGGDMGCLELVGLCDYMKQLILIYMLDDVDLIRGE